MHSMRLHTARRPHFQSGMLSEPLIAVGGHHLHVDPKTGLGLYGPYCPTGQTRPPLSTIIVGIVGPPGMAADATKWLEACQNVLLNDGREPLQHPHFPGFNADHPFQCDLVFGDTWRHHLKNDEIAAALSETNFYERIRRIVGAYVQGIEVLAQRDPKPNVVLCCVSQDVIDLCGVRPAGAGQFKRIKVSKSEREAMKDVESGQGFLFAGMDPSLGIEDQQLGHQNLRRGLKAEAMQYGIPTQLVWPRSLDLEDCDPKPGERRVQDRATRAWNLTTALYHKAGGSPWRLAHIDPTVCFIGISFYKEVRERNPRLRTSMAQAFTAAGDGYVLRGNSFEWDEVTYGRSPHLDARSATALLADVIELYKKQNEGSLPSRIVVHKTSRFWEEELEGFRDACGMIPKSDFVAFGWRGIQFYRAAGDYPPLRGTYIKFTETDLALYTVGYIPFLGTYPGARVPRPLEILEHHGDSGWDTTLREILALTKMNWNTADFACSEPITVAFARRVGHILAELPAQLPLQNEYRYYM
ncbi:hypothetical protein RAS2_18560 [Phycisphaerae bacterium RAS2]|nr:hypothetical protein RAS2_18560 [Phycisphaerae bacterium RAS2]